MAETNDKAEKSLQPSVAIDGIRIRTIRETKKLTQLYVASVVGVTTDTISRWENNRYPSIKRDNAQKLADALEVPLEEVLRPDSPEPEEGSTQPPPTPSKGQRTAVIAIVVLLVTLLLGLLLFFVLRQPVIPPSATRWTPRFAAPGEVFPVQIKVARQPGTQFGFILREKLPAGARLVKSVPPSSSSNSEVKWLVPSGVTPITASFTLQIPATFPPGKDAALKGEIVIHSAGSSNRTEAVGGSNAIHIGSYHWADSNGDGRIDDDEIMPAYYICEEMKGLGLDWKTIEAIWSGKGYRWDAKHGYTVLK
ncbi:helix-turn-helix domain-containing protein [Geomonas subterranea]|uniref:Helix-turn-helix domain-containing protein n=1 Tax=Geomonas subterranea TaxID=2847989 RepID=A0ABX8LEA3_9BACT|nr:helix-turn-helix transcriptional regulator [Geomonas subterranea]QXE90058.1 helix-turn-helix domain-containing protein [Geomonas subterranea]QXM07820.1 helix-turn-helix domain-containing protein [Geomonas subterranea]